MAELKFSKDKVTWFRPTTLETLLKIKDEYPLAAVGMRLELITVFRLNNNILEDWQIGTYQQLYAHAI